MPFTILPDFVAAFADGYGRANVAADVDTAAVALADAFVRRFHLLTDEHGALAWLAALDYDTVAAADTLYHDPDRPLLPVAVDTFHDRALALAWLVVYRAARDALADLCSPAEYYVQFYGATLDGADSLAAARTLRDRYVADVWAGRLPDLADADDFTDRADCDAAFAIVGVGPDGTACACDGAP